MRKTAKLINADKNSTPAPSIAALKDIQESEDCITELCADLIGLMWTRELGLWSKSFEDSLIWHRTLAATNDPKAYQIGVHFANGTGIKTESEIVGYTCNLGLNILAQSPNVSTDLKQAATMALSVFQQVEPNPPSFKIKLLNTALLAKNAISPPRRQKKTR
jgi:hypothetical protein